MGQLWHNTKIAFWEACILSFLFILLVSLAGAQVMTSGSYKIYSDSINVGGGNSSSTDYVLESTTGEIATGLSDSSNYNLRAGYQQMQSVYISLSSISDINMSPDLGLVGGTASGTASFLVITDSPSGYYAEMHVSHSPALQSDSNSIPNYIPSTGVPDYSFTTSTGEAFFGFTPEGTDITNRYKDDGSNCGTGALDTQAACWDTPSTTSQTIASSGSSNHPSGATTTLRFRLTIGSNANVTAGSYTATTTITALPL